MSEKTIMRERRKGVTRVSIVKVEKYLETEKNLETVERTNKGGTTDAGSLLFYCLREGSHAFNM